MEEEDVYVHFDTRGLIRGTDITKQVLFSSSVLTFHPILALSILVSLFSILPSNCRDFLKKPLQVEQSLKKTDT
jgi:hypothetical protein